MFHKRVSLDSEGKKKKQFQMELFLKACFLLLCVCNWSFAERIVYTGGEGPCGSPLCLTLQDYLNNCSYYFTNHSSFLFLPGTHNFNRSLSLDHLENLTLSGSAAGVARLVISRNSSIVVKKSHSIALQNLQIHCQGYITIPVKFLESYSVTLANIFFNINTHLFTNDLFMNGGIIIYSSDIIGIRLYLNNTAVYCNESNLELSYSIVKFANSPAAAITALLSNITLVGSSLFERNQRAIDLTYSRLCVTGNITFHNNAYIFLGGVALTLQDSTLRLQAPVSILFSYNSAALSNGGAIWVRDSDLTYFGLCHHEAQLIKPCFFEIETNSSSYHDVSLVFQGNNATAGSALYGGALSLCKVIVNGGIIENVTGYYIFTKISSLSELETISSDPLKVCPCTNGLPDCDLTSITIEGITAGKKVNIYIAAMGQVNATAADIKIHHYGSEVTLIQMNEAIEAGCNPITFQVFFIAEAFHFRLPIDMYPGGCTRGTLDMNLQIQACPSGFTLATNSCVCEEALRKLKNIECNVQSGIIENGGDSWIKPHYVNNSYRGFLWYSNCPNEYCNNNSSQRTLLNFSTPNTSNNQCANHRQGILCGTCEEGYSLTLNSLECKKCENKFLSLLVVFGLAGVGLIVLLLLLHITVASGTVNGLIFYANLFHVHRDIFYPFRREMSPFTVFLSWLNLDLGIPTCFYNGLDAYQYIWLQYAFPAYLLLLTAVIILSSKHSSRVGKLLGTNPVAVLATVILLSYTKILEVAVSALTFATLEYSVDHTQMMVWIIDGNITYFKSWAHVLLGTASIFVIIFLLLPYVLLLTFGFRLQAYSDRKVFSWFNKFTPLLDAYYAPYNRNARYWPGLLLILRIILFISYLAYRDNLMIIVSIIVIISQLKVYKKTALNFLEASFYINLCVLGAGTYHVKLYSGNQLVLTYICTGFAFLEFIGILIFHLWCRLKSSSVLLKVFCQFSSWNDRCSHKISPWKEVKSVLKEDDPANYREPLLSTGSGIISRYS